MSESEAVEQEGKPEVPSITFAEFLETVPPSTPRRVSDLRRELGNSAYLNTPILELYCDADHCGGTRFFAYRGNYHNNMVPFFATPRLEFLKYFCRNCSHTSKTFALLFEGNSDVGYTVVKVGELPPFGPPTPARLISLVGSDRDAFLKGRRAESFGLGIGAFAYYRRVVETQKNRLLDEIIRVAQRTNARQDVIERLNRAKEEGQFSKAVEMVKDAIPESLLIEGHNPLKLLHSALSEGIHAQTDEECLAIAQSIRLVLQELAERAAVALKDHAELKSALSRLLNKPTRTK